MPNPTNKEELDAQIELLVADQQETLNKVLLKNRIKAWHTAQLHKAEIAAKREAGQQILALEHKFDDGRGMAILGTSDIRDWIAALTKEERESEQDAQH